MPAGSHSDQPVATRSSDALLWLAAAIVGVVGATWLVLSVSWSPAAGDDRGQPRVSGSRPVAAPHRSPFGPSAAESPLRDPLRMARLAVEAGMLLEPAGHNAWALYAQALQQAPGNEAALAGLDDVAATLVSRGRVALEQGRFGDAGEIVERIRTVLPRHAGAADLAEALAAARPRPAPAEAPAARDASPLPAPAPEEPEPEEPDPIAAARAAFDAALGGNRLLTPLGWSARDWAAELQTLAPGHPAATEARRLLFDALRQRAEQAVTALDVEAADTWIAAASELDVDEAALDRLRETLILSRIERESARILPASELTLLDYVPPVYPNQAINRGVEGWVDVEFVVGFDGRTADVTVTDASHPALFRDEAVTAVSQWRFQPRRYLNRRVVQRSVTRIRFALQ